MFMKYSKLIITALLAFVLSAAAYAADTTKTVRFAYDLDLEMRFDNREYYKSRFSRSMTVFGARVTPAVGLAVGNDPTASHKVMVGADVMKDFGGYSVKSLSTTIWTRISEILNFLFMPASSLAVQRPAAILQHSFQTPLLSMTTILKVFSFRSEDRRRSLR